MSLSTQAPRRLRLFRMRDGVRTPYIIELDSSMTVINEYADERAQRQATGVAASVKQSRDVDFVVARWVTHSIKENPLQGTDELRRQYFSDLEKLQATHASKKTKCPPCEIGRLIRLYRAKLEDAGHLEKQE